MPLTDAAALAAAKLFKGDAQAIFGAAAYLGVGNGSATFAKTQTDLQGASKFRRPMDSAMPTRSANVITYSATFAPAEAAFAWNEWGVFNAAVSGDMLNRKVETTMGTKPSTDTWQLVVDCAMGA